MTKRIAPESSRTLDPADWQSFRAQGHRMLDDIIDYLEHIRDRPVWQPIPATVRERFRAPVPTAPTDLAAVHDEFMRNILPYSVGNAHPGFMGWVHGGGNPAGMLAEMYLPEIESETNENDVGVSVRTVAVVVRRPSGLEVPMMGRVGTSAAS